MNREDFIYYLKERIRDYEYEQRELSMMVSDWNNHSDSEYDPSIQYEQELKVDKLFREIFDFTENNKGIK